MKNNLKFSIIILFFSSPSFAGGNPYADGYYQRSNPYADGYVQDKSVFGFD